MWFARILFLLTVLVTCGCEPDKAEKVETTPYLPEADSLIMSREFDSAIQVLAAGSEQRLKAGDLPAWMTINHRMAFCLNQLRRFDESFRLLDSVRQRARTLDTTRIEFIDNDFYRAQALSFSNAPGEAMDLALKVRERYRASCDECVGLARAGNLIGDIFNFQLQDYMKAEPFYFESIRILDKIKPADDYDLLLSYYGLSASLRKKGDHIRAIAYATDGLGRIEAKPHDQRRLHSAFVNLVALIYFSKKDYQQAAKYLQESVNIGRNEKRSDLGLYLRNLGTCYAELAQFDSASAVLRESLQINRKANNAAGTCATLQSLGHLHLKKGRRDSTLYYYSKAIRSGREAWGEKDLRMSENYRLLANAFAFFGQHDSALYHYQKGLRAAFSGFEDDNVLSNPSINPEDLKFGVITLLSDKTESLFKRYQQTRDIRYALSAMTLVSNVDSLAILHLQSNITHSSGLSLAGDLTAHKGRGLPVAYALYQFTGDTAYAHKAFQLMENNRSALLLKALTESHNLNELNVDHALLRELQAINDSLSNYPDHADRRYIKLVEAKQHLTNKLRAAHASFYNARFGQRNLRLNELHDWLVKKDALLIELQTEKDTLYGIGISSAGISFKRIPLDKTIVLHLRQLTDILSKSTWNFPAEDYGNLSYRLFEKIIAPFIPSGSAFQRLIVVPDGAMSAIPFDALTTSPPGKKANYNALPYLLHQFSVSQQYSAQLMLEHFRKKESGNFLALIDETLPGAKKESSVLHRMRAHVIPAQSVSKARFKKMLERPSLLHLGMHGGVDAERGNEPFLLVPTEEPQKVYAQEIYNLSLRAQLITLTACETGTGDEARGEGVLSMARAFSYAGCPSMVASLWKLPDLFTADLSESFYKHVRNRAPLDVALQQAKRDFLQSADEYKSHPANWGGLVLIGKIDTVRTPESQRSKNILISLVMLAGAWVALLILNRK